MVDGNIQLAIKENEIGELIINIMNFADNISLIFDEVDKKMSLLDECLKSDANVNIRMQYDVLRKNYSIIHNNILSYSDDFIHLLNKMDEGKTILINKINNETQKIKEMEVRVNEHGKC